MIKNPPIIKKVVKEMGGKIKEVIPELGYFYIILKGKKIFVSRKFKISRNLNSGSELTSFKDLTHILLKDAHLPVPKTICFYRRNFSLADSKKKLKNLRYPIIIKDAEGSNSEGIFMGVKNPREAQKIIRREIKNFSHLIAQEVASGKEYRVLVLGEKIIGALEIIPPKVIGDGKKSIKKLIWEKQRKTEKRTPLNSRLVNFLKKQGFRLDSIPPKNKVIYIRESSCMAEGGETKDMTDLVNKKVKEVCIKVAMATDKYLAGIDLICDDISKDPQKQSFNIIEVNGKPDLYIHYNPTIGKTRNVVRDIINFILKLK